MGVQNKPVWLQRPRFSPPNTKVCQRAGECTGKGSRCCVAGRRPFVTFTSAGCKRRQQASRDSPPGPQVASRDPGTCCTEQLGGRPGASAVPHACAHSHAGSASAAPGDRRESPAGAASGGWGARESCPSASPTLPRPPPTPGARCRWGNRGAPRPTRADGNRRLRPPPGTSHPLPRSGSLPREGSVRSRRRLLPPLPPPGRIS